ncbi:MAG TPA: PAS domain-containing protein [Bacteroidales bacterium]|nr:PAS domain-containing protein [Bacteroidales bacterium]
MSELLHSESERQYNLYLYVHRLIDGENGRLLIDAYKPYLDTVTPTETMQVLDALLMNNYPFETVKKNVGKIINAFYHSLKATEWESPGEGHLLYYLMLENREVEKIMAEIRSILRPLMNSCEPLDKALLGKLKLLLNRLKEYDVHYLKKEIILFSYLENAFPEFRCLRLMWSFHDDYRRSLQNLNELLATDEVDKELLNKEMAKLFYVVLPLVFREEKIVFPVALRAIPDRSWQEMMAQSAEIGWCYQVQPATLNSEEPKVNIPLNLVNLQTGFLSAEQLILMLNQLPVDITFVDENDEVCYFSGGSDRVFHRTNAIIGRKVQNCHPHESVHIVNQIMEAFRAGTKSVAEFWIQMGPRFVHIRYYALRDDKGTYRGTIEVSQDVTSIRALEGSRRLLDWN